MCIEIRTKVFYSYNEISTWLLKKKCINNVKNILKIISHGTVNSNRYFNTCNIGYHEINSKNVKINKLEHKSRMNFEF